jgi:uncharacterized protein YprB with RNaseH-like and TPR domain
VTVSSVKVVVKGSNLDRPGQEQCLLDRIKTDVNRTVCVYRNIETR